VIRRRPTRVGAARVLDERQGVPVPDVRGTRDDQPSVGEHRVLVVDRFDAAVRVGERDGEGDTSLVVPRAVDEANRAGVGTAAAIDAGDAVAADHELVDVRLIAERRSPSAAPVVSVERRGRLGEQHSRERQDQQSLHTRRSRSNSHRWHS
jgi:hypothetical protein